jgi:integrase-like protein
METPRRRLFQRSSGGEARCPAGVTRGAVAAVVGLRGPVRVELLGDAMSVAPPLDSLGRRRSPAAVPGYLAGRPPRSKGRRYPADPPRTEEIIAVMRCSGTGLYGARARGLIVVLWRAGLRIQEALDLTKLDLDPRRGSILVRRGKGGRRREVGMDDWGFEQLEPWFRAREAMPVGPLFCVINGRTCGRAWHASAARAALRRRAARAGVRRRFAPHHYADPLVMPRRARRRCSGGFGPAGCRHIQRSSRNFRSVSGGR